MSVNLEQLGRAIKVAQWRNHRTLDARLRTVGSTLAQWDALRAIGNLPGASAHDLALATFQSDQAFGTLANRLEAQKLIERRPGYGRRIEHHLTPAGEAIVAAGRRVAIEVLTESFADLSEDERTQLLHLLTKLAGNGNGPDPLARKLRP
jgi:DNA-binding MarR family transcriptional regulator